MQLTCVCLAFLVMRVLSQSTLGKHFRTNRNFPEIEIAPFKSNKVPNLMTQQLHDGMMQQSEISSSGSWVKKVLLFVST